jgi:outer membrane receptor protein involved in Fe transport
MSSKILKGSLLAIAIAGASIGSTTAFAQSADGSIRGSVAGADSSTVVVISDKTRGVSKSIAVGSAGSFRSGSLAPGTYTVTVSKGGQVVDSEAVAVVISGTSKVSLDANEASVEEVIVSGARVAAIDSGIGEIGLVISAEDLEQLPVNRTLGAVTLLAPGVSRGDNAFTGTSFSGSSVAENTSFINGLNTTNFRNGLGFSKVPFEFYETIQVKTGGYSAKYGRSTGGVMNARSKSGSNEFKFGVNAYYDAQMDTSPNTYAADNNNDDMSDTTYDVYASGALIEDRVFFYGLYSETDESQEYYGVTSGRGYKEQLDGSFWGAKLDAVITDGHRLEITAFSDKSDAVEGTYEYDFDTQTVGTYLGDTLYNRGGENWVVTYTGEITDSIELSVSAGENNANRTTAPSTATSPVVYQVIDGDFEAQGGWTAFSVDEGEDQRKTMRMDLSWDLGDHFLEFGIDNEENVSTNFTVNSGGVYWLLHPENDTEAYLCDVATECPSGANVRRRTYASGGEFDVESSSYFIQDTWTVNDNLMLELGLRNETFTNFNADGDEFVTVEDQWAPRLSVSWDPAGDGRQKVFANWGLYYLPIASNTNIRLSGGETYIHDFYDWDGGQNADSTPSGVAATPYDTEVFGNGEVPDTRSVVDSELEAMYQSEFIVGYQMTADSDVTYGVKAIYRNLETSIEDVAIDAAVISQYNGNGSWDDTKTDGETVEEVFSGFHQYVLANPGAPMTVYIPEQEEWVTLSAEELNYPEASRQYAAIEATMSRPFDGKWSLDASYTWAHSWGNNEGYVRSDNGQDDAGLTTNFDQPGLTDFGSGNLPNDRRHTLKMFGSYQLENGIRLGANVMWQTGRPKGCFGIHPTDDFAAAYDEASFYCDGEPVPRGSLGTTPSYTNIDLNAQYTFDVGGSDLVVSFDLFNVLNADAVTEVQEDDTANFGKTTSFQSPRFYRMSARYAF